MHLDMYKALEMEQEFRDKLVRTAKFFLMDIINKRMALGIEDPSEDGYYTIYPGDFEKDILRVMVWVTNTYDDDRYLESRIIREIHLGEDIYITCETDFEYSDDTEYTDEIYIKSLPLDQLVNLVCTLEDYFDEIDAE